MDVRKSLTVFAGLLVVCARAQKPFYASGSQYPPVLPQNLPSTTADGTGLGNRIGEGSTTADPRAVNPVYNVEQELVDRVKDLPRDKQPFWYVNNAQLNTFRNPNGPTRGEPADGAVQRRDNDVGGRRRDEELRRLERQRVQLQQRSQASQAAGGPGSEQWLRSREQYRTDLEEYVRRQEEDLRRSREQLRQLQRT